MANFIIFKMQSETKTSAKTVELYHALSSQKFDFQVLPRINLSHHQWSSQMTEQDNSKFQEIIQGIVKAATSESDLFRKIMPLVIDYLFLRGEILSIFTEIKMDSLILRKKDLYETLKNVSFSQFIILLLKMNEQKDIFGLLLSSVRVPLPIFMQIEQIEKKPVNMIEVLKRIMGIDKHSLIFNCGSKMARKCGKTSFLFELFSLPKDYQYYESPFYEASVYIHKMFPGNENNLLADFNGSVQNMPAEVSIWHLNSGLLIFHILESELYNKEEKFIGGEYFSKYTNILDPSQKTIILIRNCTKQTESESVLASLGNLRKKSLVFCLSQNVVGEAYGYIARQCKRQKLFELNKTFNYFDILNDPQKTSNIQSYYKDSQKIINMLPSSDSSIGETNENLTKVIFPYLFISNQISILSSNLLEKQLQYKLHTGEKKEEAYKIIKHKEIEIGRLKEKLKTGSEISNFVKKGFEILTDGIRESEKIQVFRTILYFWKKQMVKPQLNQYIKVTREINELSPAERQKKEFLMKQVEKIQEKLDMYDISITTILNDVIIRLSEKDETKESEQEKQSRKLSLTTIQTSYNVSFKSMYPINLVDGKNLTFGNKYLRQYCKNLSLDKRFANKKVYIISVVGVQSSGKSTLLNYLFRCQFETSAGRCTKGMYFNICEFEDKIIWLIDTEGLASLNARDPLFDNKVATFVLSISNIVIINNKGQLNNQLKDMLEICTFAMKYLKRQDKARSFKPQKLIFALRDQAMPKKDQKFQEQMVSKIMNEFEKSKEKLDMNYKQYLDLQPDDIISFPSIFNETEVKFKTLGSMESYNYAFGRCIVGLRSRIMSILDNEQGRSSIFDCYTKAEVCWQTILKCGSDLMNFKTLGELAEKQFILSSYLGFYANYNKELNKQFRELFQTLTKDFDSKYLEKMETKIKSNLIKKKEQKLQQFKRQLRTHCGGVCDKDEWYDVCNDKILALCLSYQNNYMNRLSDLKMKLQQDESLGSFVKQVDDEVKQLLLKNTTQEQIHSYLKKLKELVFSRYDEEQKKFSAIQKLFQIQIASALQQGLQYDKLTANGVDWALEFKKVQKSNNCSRIYERNSKDCMESNASIQKLQLYYFQRLSQKIEQFCKKNINIHSIPEISQIAQNLDKNLRLIHSQIQQQIFLERPDKDVVLLEYHKVCIQDVIRGCLISKLVQTFKNNGREEIKQRRANCELQIEKYLKKITEAFKSKENIKQNSLTWIKQVVEYYQKVFYRNCKEKLQQELDLLKNQIDPELLIDSAFKYSFLKYSSDKNKWIECFKMITNTNKYLFQILCKQSLITTRQTLSSDVLSSQKQAIKDLFQNQFMAALKNLKTEYETKADQQTEAALIQDIKSKYQLLKKSSNFTDKEILILMKTTLDDSEFYRQQMKQLETHVTIYELNASLELYINTTLRDFIVGCPHTCPFCGVKCKKRKNHDGGHEVKDSCHIISCFNGPAILNTNHPSYYICGTEAYLTKVQFRYNKYGAQKLALPFLAQHYNDWLEHFQNMVNRNLYQSTLQEVKYQEIWANVGKMLIKHKHKSMVDDHKFQELENDPLNDYDLQNCKFYSLEGRAIPLLDYVTH